ncbi:thioredoxin family protein [Niveibacterium terrae]|uniref:thioredoxin family protein n=1 Tax=Niveibacterium terrae TaxID=3373598 RepID=UPI003A9132B1
MPRLKLTAAALFAAFTFITPCVHAATPSEAPAYDEKADANAELAHALAKAKASRRQVLVIFGANWCPDCRALARQMANDKVAKKLSRRFVLTKVEIGNWDHNMDIVNRYGNPTKKGIPAVAVLDSRGQLLKATAAGELASARSMGEAEVLAVFDTLAAH